MSVCQGSGGFLRNWFGFSKELVWFF